MQMNVAGLRRNIKNLAHNYSDAQVKVREATSNDPWGPSSTIMAEIADLTYNVVAFSEIMQMIWKRTNDHGKNWRHVYKALLLLEYLIKTGSEKVAQQCKENIFSITTLKDFQYLEEGKDQGVHVREKAKQMVMLLKDDERLKNERARALKAKERFARTASGFGSDGSIDGPSRDRDTPVWPESDRPSAQGASGGAAAGTEIEFVRPQTVGEEELQLQLAIAMSREEAEQEEQKKRSDDVRLQLALSQSEQDFKVQKVEPKESHLVDLLDISFGATTVSASGQNNDPWGLSSGAANNQRPMQNDMWSGKSTAADPWLPPQDTFGYAATGNDWPRSKSPSIMSDFSRAPVANSTSIEGWLQNVQPAAAPALPIKTNEPWMNRAPVGGDPWNNKPQQVPDPWDPSSSMNKDSEPLDPWNPSVGQVPTAAPRQTTSALAQLSPNSDLDDFDIITNRSKSAQLQAALSPNNDFMNRQNNNNDVNLLDSLDPLGPEITSNKKQQMTKTPHSFLGENSALVNLDNLIKPVNNVTNNNAYNPFSESQPKNLFQQNQPPIPSINQLKQQQAFPTINPSADPWAPNNDSQNNLNNNSAGWMINSGQQQQQSNPFLS